MGFKRRAMGFKRRAIVFQLRVTGFKHTVVDFDQRDVHHPAARKCSIPMLCGSCSFSFQHSTMLHALHRRVLLDDARVLLSDTYGIPVNELRPGGQGVSSGKPKTLQQLVMDVRSKLRQDDAHWLHDDALKMIFDSSLGTLRSGGDAAAHCASKENLRLAINDPGLTASHTATLKNICAFTHKWHSGHLDTSTMIELMYLLDYILVVFNYEPV
jgi:hypothetical protein